MSQFNNSIGLFNQSDSTSLLETVTRFYNDKIIHDHYWHHYLDDHYYSVSFIVGMIILALFVCVMLPLKTFSVLYYCMMGRRRIFKSTAHDRRQEASSSTNALQEESSQERENLRTCHSSSTRSMKDTCLNVTKFMCLEVCAGWVPSFLICILLCLLILFASTFSKIHFAGAAMLMSLVMLFWLVHSVMLDGGVFMAGLFRTVKKVKAHYHLRKRQNVNAQKIDATSTALEMDEKNGGVSSDLNHSHDASKNHQMETSNSSSSQQSNSDNKGIATVFVEELGRTYFESLSSPIVKKHPIVIGLLVFLLFCLTFGIFIVTTVVSSDFCVAYDPIEVSTFITRKNDNEICREGICFTYMTISRDISTQMIVNFQVVATRLDDAYVYYGTFNPQLDFQFNSNTSSKVQASCFKLDKVINEISRYQCYANILNLTPSSSYYMKSAAVGVPNYSSSQASLMEDPMVYKFRTAPSASSNSDRVVSFVNGGDFAWKEATFQLASVLTNLGSNVTTCPYFAMVGGDISYENGCPYCYPRWDRWFKYWAKYMVVKIDYSSSISHTYTLPIATAVGNHEAGNFKRSSRVTNAYYIRLFPHEIETTTAPVPLIVADPQNSRALQYIHYLSNHTVVMVLDSWVHDSPAQQVDFIVGFFSNLTKNNDKVYKNRIVVIHECMYTSAKTKSSITLEMRDKWEHLFLKYNVTLVLENHVHTYKQTYPLRFGKVMDATANPLGSKDGALNDYSYERNIYGTNGGVILKEDEKAIIYAGDGSWGAHYYGDVIDWGNPIFRQIGIITHFYHVMTFDRPDGTSVIQTVAYGYDETTGNGVKIQGSGLTITTK
ncbi:hypothetical protein C9374_009302 [Naegleria lovaniensis]|uniref:Calcineurin-like phosphoesterase domain-containing protein n=1 Tax=Naegleria lovaniensis TaxID=51637 RepID=A0AA88GJ04_NAELO|nr:uncharacterized protein C9374_009302 [Naegleria lovaniensis]KAG2377391.1 hypothetical protein C9374_009302 [Naegleria lovaniensis]